MRSPRDQTVGWRLEPPRLTGSIRPSNSRSFPGGGHAPLGSGRPQSMAVRQKSRRSQRGQRLVSAKISEFRNNNTGGPEAAELSAFKIYIMLY